MTSDRIKTRIHSHRLGVVLVVGALMALAPAGAAMAKSDPTRAQYDSAVTQVSGQTGGGGDGAKVASAPRASGLQKSVVSGLPFTGLDLIALFGVALALTSMGFALRRLSTKRDQTS